MKKTLNPTLTIAPDFLLRQFGWAFRYCANRSSYAASDCIDMALYIHANRDKFDPERVKFQARDLLCEANNRLGWKDNVNLSDDDNTTTNYPAYIQIAEVLADNPGMRFCDYGWWVDCYDGKVKTYKREEPLTSPCGGLAKLYDCDIKTVCIAADIIDPDKHYMVTTLWEGKESSIECVKSFVAEQIYDEEKHITVDYKYSEVYRTLHSPHSWLTPEYITKIEKI